MFSSAPPVSQNPIKEEKSSRFKDEPQFLVDGKINPAYDTSKLQDAVSGLGIGAQLGVGQDPYYQLGAMIGGLAGGLAFKNTAGVRKWRNDVEETRNYNERVIEQTNAELRLKAYDLNVQKQADSNYWKARTAALREQGMAQKDFDATMKFYNSQLESIPSTDIEGRAELLGSMKEVIRAKYPNMPAEYLENPEFGVKLEPFKAGENWMLRSKDGLTVREMTLNGKPVTDMTITDFKTLYDLMNGPDSSAKMSVTPETMTVALGEARQIVSSQVKGRNLKPSQTEAMVFNLATWFAKSKVQNPEDAAQRRAFFRERLGYLLGTEIENTDTPKPQESDSPFMPPLDGKTEVVKTPAEKSVQQDIDKVNSEYLPKYRSDIEAVKAKNPEELYTSRTALLSSQPQLAQLAFQDVKFVDGNFLNRMLQTKWPNTSVRLFTGDSGINLQYGGKVYGLDSEADYVEDPSVSNGDIASVAKKIGTVAVAGGVRIFYADYDQATGKFKVFRLTEVKKENK